MQLDVDMSPPAIIYTSLLLCSLVSHYTFPAKSQGCRPNGSRDMNFFLVFDFFLVTFGPVQDRRTDGQKATPKSPPCTSTGGLKNASRCW